MGCCQSDAEDDHLTMSLLDVREEETPSVCLENKVFLLGTGSSGKSAIRSLLSDDWHKLEVHDFRADLVYRLEQLAIDAEEPSLHSRMSYWTHLVSKGELRNFSAEQLLQLKTLASAICECPKIQEASAKFSFRHLYGASRERWLLKNSEAIFSEDFKVTADNWYHLRGRTSGVSQSPALRLAIGDGSEGRQFRLVDFGGERSERKKWARCWQQYLDDAKHCFVVFVVCLPHCWAPLYEEASVNAMQDSIQLFQKLISADLPETQVCIVFNKRVEFDEALLSEERTLNECFGDGCDTRAEFDTDQQYTDACFQFVLKRFEKVWKKCRGPDCYALLWNSIEVISKDQCEQTLAEMLETLIMYSGFRLHSIAV